MVVVDGDVVAASNGGNFVQETKNKPFVIQVFNQIRFSLLLSLSSKLTAARALPHRAAACSQCQSFHRGGGGRR